MSGRNQQDHKSSVSGNAAAAAERSLQITDMCHLVIGDQWVVGRWSRPLLHPSIPRNTQSVGVWQQLVTITTSWSVGRRRMEGTEWKGNGDWLTASYKTEHRGNAKKFRRGVIIICRSRSINYCPYLVHGLCGDIPSIKRQSVGQAGRQAAIRSDCATR